MKKIKNILCMLFFTAMILGSTGYVYADEHTQLYTNAGDSFSEPIVMGNQYEGVLNSSGKLYLAFTTSANKSFYNLEFNNRSSYSMETFIYRDIYASDCIYSDYYIGSRTDEEIDLKNYLQPNTTYYIYIEGKADAPVMINFIEYVDDHADTCQEATPIAMGAWAEGTTHDGNDLDVFRFDTDGQKDYHTLHFENRSDETMEVYVYEDLYMSRKIASNTYYYRGSYSINLGSINDNSSYYIVTKGRTTGQQYAVAVSQVVDDYADTANCAKGLAYTKGVSGKIENTVDVDWFSFSTNNNKIDYYLNMVNKDAESTVYFKIYSDVNHTILVEDHTFYGKGNYTLNLSKLSKKHKYYIQVSGGVAAYSLKVTPRPKSFADAGASLKGIKGGFVYKVNKNGDYSGYEIRYRVSDTKRWKKKTYNTSKKVSATIKGLRRNTYYDVQIRAFYKYKGKKYYSDWANYKYSYGYDVRTK